MNVYGHYDYVEQVNLKLVKLKKIITDMLCEQMNFDMHCFKKSFHLEYKSSSTSF